MASEKVVSLAELAHISEAERASGKRIVLCHGAFDLLHAGHIRHLQRARKEGDLLVVTLTADEYINKGPDRPVFKQDLRAESLAALACVDYVAVNHAITAINLIDLIKPHVYAKGSEYRQAQDDVTGNIVHEQNAVEAHGGRIFFTDEITFSSSNLLNEHFSLFPPATKNYLNELRTEFSEKQIFSLLESLAGKRVLIVGDAIIDEYHYTTPLGQTGKSNILAVRYDSEERFAGGAMAVANHLAEFVAEVVLVTALGREETGEDFIRSRLKPGVEPVFFYRDDSPTLVKRRFVDPDMDKLFEVYFYNENPLPERTEDEILDWLNAHCAQYDAVIVPDFGNGLIGPCMVDMLAAKSKFLAVNTQINSGNRGFHAVTRYPHADFISINEPELRLATHNKHADLEVLAREIATKLDAKAIAITRGTKGALFVDAKSDQSWEIPALSMQVVDRIGAGDSFLAVAGLCAASGLPHAISGFAASAAAALAVQMVCNRDSVNGVVLRKFIKALLK